MSQTQFEAAEPALSHEELDRGFGALADRTRRAILARLTEGDAGVLEVAAPFPMSQPAITKHLRVLEDAGLVSRHRLARQRMCHLEAGRLKQLSDWVGSYREFWEESFERLDELLEELQGEERDELPVDTAEHPMTPERPKRPKRPKRRKEKDDDRD